jgi:hypothetical protein
MIFSLFIWFLTIPNFFNQAKSGVGAGGQEDFSFFFFLDANN